MSPLELYLGFVYIVALLIVPVAAFATVFAWIQVRNWSGRPDRPVLAIVLAIVSTMSFLSSTYFGALVVLRIGTGKPAPAELLPLSGTVFVATELLPILIMGYLIWRRQQRPRR